LAVLLLHPERSWYFSDLAKELGFPASTLQRDLKRLAAAGVLKTWKEGNRAYFQADETAPIFGELHSLLAKTSGLVEILREALSSVAKKVRWAFVYGSMAAGGEASQSDVDLMMIGDVGLSGVAPLLRAASGKLLRPINPTVYTADEFFKKSDSRFIKSVLGKPMLFVIGSQDDLERSLDSKTGGARTVQQGRN